MNIYLLMLKTYTTTKTMEGECKTNRVTCREKENLKIQRGKKIEFN